MSTLSQRFQPRRGEDAQKRQHEIAVARLHLYQQIGRKVYRHRSLHGGVSRAGAALLETAFTMEDIAAAIGKKAGVLAVCDAGFAEKLKQELGAVSEERAHALHASEKDR